MRLIFKITLLYAVISLFVFIVGAFISFNVMRREIDKEQRYYIEERMEHILKRLEKKPLEKEWVREKIRITPLPELVPEGKPRYSDTLAMHSTLQRIEPHLKLDIIKNVNGRSYKIMMYDLMVESDDIEDAVRESMSKTYLILLIAVITFGFIGSYFLFKPFYKTLEVIKSFSLRQNDPIRLVTPSTIEFKKLNSFIEEMTGKVKKDYQSLKEFSENASHEIQTPLAVAQGKLELLMESANLSEEQLELINSAQTALRRLSKLSVSLGLLTKIDNKEFSDFTEIDFSSVCNCILKEFNELAGLKTLTMESDIEEGVTVQGNRTLLEILLSNLLNNAIRHNIPNGEIGVILSSNTLRIENSGKPLEVPSEDLFERFKKGTDNPDSWGLGLSIVKKICEQHHFEVSYRWAEQKHVVEVQLTT